MLGLFRPRLDGDEIPLQDRRHKTPSRTDSERAPSASSHHDPPQTPTRVENTAEGFQEVDLATPDRGSAALHDGEILELPISRYIIVSLGIGFGLFLAILDTSIVSTTLFAMANEFECSLDKVNWVALAYSLTYLGFTVLFARISDIIGRRAAYLVAYTIFILASVAAGCSATIGQLVAFRAVQGLGGSGLYSLSMVLLLEVTPDGKKFFISGIVGAVIAASGVLGPILGGFLSEFWTWRAVFWLNGPVGLVSAVVFFFSWPDRRHQPTLVRRRWQELDYFGSFLLLACSIMVVYAFQSVATSEQGWAHPIFVGLLSGGLGLTVGLVAYAGCIPVDRAAAALPRVLFRNRIYTASVVHTLCVGFPYLLSVYTFPLQFQVVYGKSSLEAGLILLPMLVSSAFGSMAVGVLNKTENRVFESLVAASSLMIIGYACETTIPSTPGFPAKAVGFLVFMGLGFGMSAATSTMIAGTESPIQEHATAQGILAQMRVFGGSIGIAVASAIAAAKVRSELAGKIPSQMLESLAHHMPELDESQRTAVRETYTNALRLDMIICCGVSCAALCFAACTHRRSPPTTAELTAARRVAAESRPDGRGLGTV